MPTRRIGLLNALQPAFLKGGDQAALKVWQEHEKAGIDVAPGSLWANLPAEREWLVPGWLPRGRVVLFSGKGGGGKSRLTLQLAAALVMDADRWINAFASKANTGVRLADGGNPVNVVIATWEDEADEIARRLWRLGAAGPWGVVSGVQGSESPHVPDVKALAERLHVADMAGAGPLWAPRAGGSGHVSTMGALTAKGRWLRRFCEGKVKNEGPRGGARLLIVDPLAAAFALNENDRGLVRGFVSDWDRWGRTNDCAVLFIAHPPKNDAEWSGSTDWHAANRAVWTLNLEETGTGAQPEGHDGNPKGRRAEAKAPRLECFKSSYAERKPEDVWLRVCGSGWLATDKAEAAKAAEASGFVKPSGGGRERGKAQTKYNHARKVLDAVMLLVKSRGDRNKAFDAYLEEVKREANFIYISKGRGETRGKVGAKVVAEAKRRIDVAVDGHAVVEPRDGDPACSSCGRGVDDPRADHCPHCKAWFGGGEAAKGASTPGSV